MTARTLTAVIIREGQLFVALCPEFDVVSQGESVEDARLKHGGTGAVLRNGASRRDKP